MVFSYGGLSRLIYLFFTYPQGGTFMVWQWKGEGWTGLESNN